LRQRVVASFVVLVGVSLLVVGTYVYFQTEHRLMQEVDSSLHAAASQALLSMEDQGGRVIFRSSGSPASQSEVDAGFALRSLSVAGELWDSVGQTIAGLPNPPTAGYLTVNASGDNWRVVTQEIPGIGGQTRGWVQVGKSLEPTEEVLATLRTQLYFVLPIALLLSAIAGYLLAGRTLRPLVRISQVADTIRPGDFGRRIRYRGPKDEIGRLAGAFDRMLDRVEEAFVRERRFTSDASHELRTPLTAIKGGIGVTLSRRRTPEEYETALQALEGQVDRLIRLSTELLDVARAGGARSDQPEILDLSDLLLVVAQQVEPLAAEQEVKIEIDVPEGLRVSGFTEDLVRVFLNLLTNAISYTPSSGSIRISARAHSQAGARWVAVAVADTGPGIDGEDLPHIFEPFYRGVAARSHVDGGSGLGLAIAKELVAAHEGSLDVVSKLGRGSTFTVRLPAIVGRARS
jgi:signal transduction histidine kinase